MTVSENTAPKSNYRIGADYTDVSVSAHFVQQLPEMIACYQESCRSRQQEILAACRYSAFLPTLVPSGNTVTAPMIARFIMRLLPITTSGISAESLLQINDRTQSLKNLVWLVFTLNMA